VGFDAGYVRRAVSGFKQRCEDITSRAAALLDGVPINLASSQQVSISQESPPISSSS